MAESTSQDDSAVSKGEHYSEFEALYESVLFKKPELLTTKVFVNAMNEIKLMQNKINTPELGAELAQVDDLMATLYQTVHHNFPQLDKEQLAKLLITVKDKFQSKKPGESVGKIVKVLNEYLTVVKDTTEKEKEAVKHDTTGVGKGKKVGKEKKEK